MSRLRTDAWLLRGISSIPGTLMIQGHDLSFIVSGTGSAWPWQLRKLERELGVSGLATFDRIGKPVHAFRWPVHALQVSVPWYYFGGGMKVEYRACRLRFSFGAPARTGLRPGDALANLRDVRTMRVRGKLWLAALQEDSQGPACGPTP